MNLVLALFYVDDHSLLTHATQLNNWWVHIL